MLLILARLCLSILKKMKEHQDFYNLHAWSGQNGPFSNSPAKKQKGNHLIMHQFYAEATFIMSKINSDVIYRVRENMQDDIKKDVQYQSRTH